jgi:molecular chaperone GrpE
MEEKDREALEQQQARGAADEGAAGGEAPVSEEDELKELKDRYLRLYADFENYKKKVARDKEELVKYSNEHLIYELLPSLDHLEIALRHAGQDNQSALVEGVERTLREFQRTLEKFGLKPIEAMGKPFDPNFHHAMTQVERDDVAEKTVVEEFRKGYTYRDKVLRASMVAVSRKPASEEEAYNIEINRGGKEDS